MKIELKLIYDTIDNKFFINNLNTENPISIEHSGLPFMVIKNKDEMIGTSVTNIIKSDDEIFDSMTIRFRREYNY